MTVQEQYTLWRARAIDDPDLTAEEALDIILGGGANA